MTDLTYSYLMLKTRHPNPRQKKTKAQTRGITPHKNHTCVGRIIEDVVIEVMNCAYAAHLLIVAENFQPFLKNWLTSEKTEQSNNTLLDIEEDLPIHAHGPLGSMVPVRFWVQVVSGRSSSSSWQECKN